MAAVERLKSALANLGRAITRLAEQDRTPRTHARAARIVVWVALGVFAAAVAFDVASSSPGVCASCHEMEARTEAWAESAHTAVTCVECHLPVRPWYARPVSLYERGMLLGRDVVRHVAGGYQDPVEMRAPNSPEMADTICLQCHDPNRKATSGYRILIDHPEHAKQNGSCVSCHLRTAHPEKDRGGPLTFMAQCFTCHGEDEDAEAPARCDLCHPSDYELLPASHEDRLWDQDHGASAIADERLCVMCHEPSVCSDCHGLAMPHPQDWSKGKTGHAQVALDERAVCDRCHGRQPDMCTMCHHTDYVPAKGTWAQQHFMAVRTEGASYCMECHSPLYCVDCHVP